MAENDKKKNSSDEDILRVARERFLLAEEAEITLRQDALEDLKFRAGDQWPDDVKRTRDQDHRPCLTINRIPQFIRQITNDQRQNRPSIKVFPVDDNADVETAKIYQGLIRHIEYNSSADVAYDTAFEGAVTKSFGFFRIITDYVDPKSFDQEILIKRIRNSFSVYLDPNAKEPVASDMNWAFIVDDYSKDDFKAEFKGSKMASMDDWASIGDSIPGWATKDSCRVVEYFYKDFEEITLVQTAEGEILDESELAEDFPEDHIVNRRKSTIPVIKWCKLNAVEVMEETVWPGRWIPIVPVYGDELDIDGKLVREGIVRHARDPQRMLNFWVSAETETIALAPKAPFIAAEGQIPPEYEAQWKSANTKTHSHLIYKPITVSGVPVSAPQRNVYEAPVQAITNARMQASEDLKATTGIYDAALGNHSNEVSGVAIRGRQQQSQTSNFHFIDNLSRSLCHAGRIIVDLIPKVYDTARAVRILGEDGQQEIVRINEVFEQHGKPKLIDLSAGKYDVTVETGPSYATKRQEAVASMLDLSRTAPQLMASAGDLMVKNMDWPGAQEIADRLKKTLPPGIIEDKEKPPVPPEVQAQLQQLSEQNKQLIEHLNAATEAIKTKKLDLESKERIAFAQMEVDMKKELLKANAPMAQSILAQEIEQINQRLGLLDFNEPIEPDFNEGGSNGALPSQMQQPTGGQAPGNNLGVNP